MGRKASSLLCGLTCFYIFSLSPPRLQAFQHEQYTIRIPFSASNIGASSSNKISFLNSSASFGDSSSSFKQHKGDKFRRENIFNPPSKKTSSRDPNYFKLQRLQGKIEFGYTTALTTDLPGSPETSIEESRKIITSWLQNVEKVAFAIWDENLITKLGNQYYRLQLMTVQFVTIKLAPYVDVNMWTEIEKQDTEDGHDVVFLLESSSFDPQIQLLPGVNFSAESLGVKIDVAGELRVTKDGRGLTGRIGFVSGGTLPPPLRILPESALRGAASIINKQIADFAVRSFERGAIKEYKKFIIQEDK